MSPIHFAALPHIALACLFNGVAVAAQPDSLPNLAAQLRAHPTDAITAARVASSLMHRDWLLPSPPPTNTAWLPSAAIIGPASTEITSPDQELRLRWASEHLELVQTTDGTSLARVEFSPTWKSVAWHPGGVVLAVSREGSLELRNGRTLARLPLQPARVDGAAFAFSPDGLWLAASDPAGGINLWDWAEGRLLAQGLPSRTGFRELAFSADGRWLRARSTQGEVTLDARPSRALGPSFTHESPIVYAGLLPDGRRTLALHADGFLQLWTGGDREMKNSVRLAAFPNFVIDSPDHAWLALALPSGKARVWNSTNCRPLGEWLNHPGGIAGLAFDRNRRWLWIGGGTTLRAWDFSRLPPSVGTVSMGAPIACLAGSPDAGWVAALRSTETSPLLQWWISTDTNAVPHHQVQVGSTNFFAFAPNSKQIMAPASPGRVARWNLGTGEQIGPEIDHGAPVIQARWSPNGQRLVTAGADGSVRVWQLKEKDLEPAGPAIHDGNTIAHVELDPTGRNVLVSGADRNWRVFDVATGRSLTESWPVIGRIPAHRPIRADGVRFSADGSRVLVPDTEVAARWLPLPPVGPPPVWLTNLVAAVLGEGIGDPVARIKSIRQQVTREPIVKEVWLDWVRWYLADRAERPTSPRDTLELATLVGRNADLNVIPALLEAARLEPGSEWMQRQLIQQMRTNQFWGRPFQAEQSVWLEKWAQRKGP